MYKLIGIYAGKAYAIDDTKLLYGRGIHIIVGPDRAVDEVLDAVIEMAIDIANLEVYQMRIKLSAIMAHFVKDL